MTAPKEQVRTPAKIAAAEIYMLSQRMRSNYGRLPSESDIEAIISRALLSAQRPYVEALETIAGQGEGESPTSRVACMAAIASLALRKQVGGEK